MKKLLLILVCALFTSCVTNYYFVNIEEDTPIYKNINGRSESIIVIPKGNNAFIAFGTKKHRKIKWKTYNGWAINPIYSNPTNSNYSRKSKSSSKNCNSSSSRSSSGGTVHVKGYTRKDGTYVRPHTRSAPKRKH
ncbi:hypothetical protein [Flavobacterium yafengii]|uniref:hypothetical protein n=1 Tax=Flavobacterium yafengii TaxID=3041253 RepID=UPI0024A9F231|nr:hypothetical protein [Flavobacterium yafengii]MDI5888528.1 hypothetical protein [Flavobacterium yafengii]